MYDYQHGVCLMNKLPFSVSMSVYKQDNYEWFETALRSVTVTQTLKPDEVVLVVDGPVSSEIDDVINKFEILLNNDSKKRFKVIRLKDNTGHGCARRCGIENCSNELIALMDADDICLPKRFEKQIKRFIMDDTISIVGGNISEFIGTPDNIVAHRFVPCNDEQIKEFIKIRCPFNQVTVMFKKSDVQKAGGYLDWYCNEDYYLWLRMYLENYRFANIDDILVNVRVGKEMYSRRGGRRYFESEKKLQNYMLDKGIIDKSTYFVNVLKRLVVQLLLPNSIRGWVFRNFARNKV